MHYFKRIKRNGIDVVVKINVNLYSEKDLEIFMDENFINNIACLIAQSKKDSSLESGQFSWIQYEKYARFVRALNVANAPIKVEEEEEPKDEPLDISSTEIRELMGFLGIAPIKFVSELDQKELETLLKRNTLLNRIKIKENPEIKEIDSLIYAADKISKIYEKKNAMEYYGREIVAAPTDELRNYWLKRMEELFEDPLFPKGKKF